MTNGKDASDGKRRKLQEVPEEKAGRLILCKTCSVHVRKTYAYMYICAQAPASKKRVAKTQEPAPACTLGCVSWFVHGGQDSEAAAKKSKNGKA